MWLQPNITILVVVIYMNGCTFAYTKPESVQQGSSDDHIPIPKQKKRYRVKIPGTSRYPRILSFPGSRYQPL